jgi:hypothetical protein
MVVEKGLPVVGKGEQGSCLWHGGEPTRWRELPVRQGRGGGTYVCINAGTAERSVIPRGIKEHASGFTVSRSCGTYCGAKGRLRTYECGSHKYMWRGPGGDHIQGGVDHIKGDLGGGDYI